MIWHINNILLTPLSNAYLSVNISWSWSLLKEMHSSVRDQDVCSAVTLMSDEQQFNGKAGYMVITTF